VTFTVAHLSVEPYDDSHFFKRVALNALQSGKLAWNLDEGPVYGSTSQLFQWLAVPVIAIAQGYSMLAMRVLTAAFLVAAFALVLRSSYEFDRGLAATAAFVSPVLLFPTLSGMETTLAFLLVALVLLLLFSERGRRTRVIVLPILVTLLYLARPDAILLVIGPIVAERWRSDLVRARREAALLALFIAGCLLAFKLYYGTALPLPFYAKQAAFSPYDANFIQASNSVRSVRFGLFLAFAFPLLLLALQKRDTTNLVLVGSAVTFSAYHFFLTIEVMGMHGRFHAPALPILAVAAARGASALSSRPPRARTGLLLGLASTAMFCLLGAIHWLPFNTGFRLEKVELLTYGIVAPAVVFACVAGVYSTLHARAAAVIIVLTTASHAFALDRTDFKLFRDQDYLALQTERYSVYRGLDTLHACFGERIHVYHSEVGLPGLRFQHGKVSDLAGLLSPEWLFEGKGAFDRFCTRDRPEAIFLPHKNYRALNSEILAGRCIRGYRRVVEKSSSPLYIRNDLHSRFLQCAEARNDPFVRP
jgi:hypothetical protein